MWQELKQKCDKSAPLMNRQTLPGAILHLKLDSNETAPAPAGPATTRGRCQRIPCDGPEQAAQQRVACLAAPLLQGRWQDGRGRTWPRPCSMMARWKMRSDSPVSISCSTSSGLASRPVTVYTLRPTVSLHRTPPLTQFTPVCGVPSLFSMTHDTCSGQNHKSLLHRCYLYSQSRISQVRCRKAGAIQQHMRDVSAKPARSAFLPHPWTTQGTSVRICQTAAPGLSTVCHTHYCMALSVTVQHLLPLCTGNLTHRQQLWKGHRAAGCLQKVVTCTGSRLRCILG